MIKGHAPRGVFVEDVGHVVPPEVCYVSPEVPSEALIAILKERDKANAEAAHEDATEEHEGEETDDSAPHATHDNAPRRGRPRKH